MKNYTNHWIALQPPLKLLPSTLLQTIRRTRVGSNRHHFAFTLVELLIAMTITMLLMAALGKSFAVIGKTMKEGRGQVQMSSKLRGISFRLRTDLRRMTAKATPPISSDSGAGYFMYYEGPLTEHTFSLFGAEPTQTTPSGSLITPSDPLWNAVNNSPTYRKQSRLGDFDDYIAFTAEAPGNDWFTGKVPAYVVDDSLTTSFDRMAPRTIRSKFAEIIIWAAPRWAVSASNGLVLADHPAGMPRYLDQENGTGDLAPDDIVLHQRILLIRPDLNLQGTISSTTAAPFVGGDFESAYLRPKAGSTAPDGVPPELSTVYPLSNMNPYVSATSDADNREMLASNWLIGMTGMHHFFDVSLRRVIHPETGEPTPYVAANTLEDLTQPHNRFAHVRYPGRYFGRGATTGAFDSRIDFATSMPLLAVGWNDTILSWQGTEDPRASTPTATAPGWFPAGHPSSTTLNAAGGSRTGLFNGWLLPHFELGDPNPVDTTEASHWQRGYLAATDRRWDRTGEDVIGSNILAFDVKGFDPNAPLFITAGPDGQPGRASVNDDNYPTTGANMTDQSVTDANGINHTELGFVGSDDVLLKTNDIALGTLMQEPILHPTNATPLAHLQGLAGRGDFVDLFFPHLPGTPLLDNMRHSNWTTTPPLAVPATPPAYAVNVGINYDTYLQTSLSGGEIPRTGMNALKRSGKLVHSNGTGGICYFQPTYDTWTDAYESDGFDQTQTVTGGVSTTGIQHGTTWVLNNVSGVNTIPRLVPGGFNTLQIDTGKYLPGTPETSPPIPLPLSALQITVRLNDPSSGELMQFSVVEGLQ